MADDAKNSLSGVAVPVMGLVAHSGLSTVEACHNGHGRDRTRDLWCMGQRFTHS